MKLKRLYTWLLVALISAIAGGCGIPNYSDGDLGHKYLSVGFKTILNGVKTEVVLLRTGDVVLFEPVKKEYQKVAKIKRTRAWLLFQAVKKAGIREEVINEPGNFLRYDLTYFKRGKTYTWTWGKKGADPPEKVAGVVNELMDLAKVDKK